MRYPPLHIPEAMIPRLGNEPDADIAGELGVNQTAVARARRRLGIPAMRAHHDWTARELQLLGTDSDEQVSMRLKLGRALVRYQRRKLGIPAYYTDEGGGLK